MPVLHSCSLRGCETRTLGTYCYEHALLIRAEIEAERAQAAIRDQPITRELAAVTMATMQPELRSA